MAACKPECCCGCAHMGSSGGGEGSCASAFYFLFEEVAAENRQQFKATSGTVLLGIAGGTWGLDLRSQNLTGASIAQSNEDCTLQ